MTPTVATTTTHCCTTVLLLLQVVHIDLGIAFEQGMFLNTPERVPFRLTANVVDGMGAAGTEGPFRRCCETTLEVWKGQACAAQCSRAIFM